MSPPLPTPEPPDEWRAFERVLQQLLRLPPPPKPGPARGRRAGRRVRDTKTRRGCLKVHNPLPGGAPAAAPPPAVSWCPGRAGVPPAGGAPGSE